MRIALYVFILIIEVVGAFPCAAEMQWHDEKGFKWAELSVTKSGKPGFTLLPPTETGITFTNPMNERAIATNRVLANGSGVALGDYDGDGRPDIFFPSLDGRNALYRNLGGMKFQDVTKDSGIVCPNQSCRGAVFADINGDGRLDLLISTTESGVFCFINKGNGTFEDISQSAGTLSKLAALTMTLADINGDGRLALYVANNRPTDSQDSADVGRFEMSKSGGKPTIPTALQNQFVIKDGVIEEYGQRSLLYLNDGKGRFTPVSWTNGSFLDEGGKPLTGPPLDWSLSAAFHDLNGDGAPDIYECNDYWTPDRCWINDGHGRFGAASTLALRHTSKYSMGVDFADIDRDGLVDFCTVDMLARDWRQRKRQMLSSSVPRTPAGVINDQPQIPRNMLFRNRGDGTFEEIAAYAGVSASDWAWQPVFVDVDLDGYEDLIIPTGFATDANDLDLNERGSKLRRSGQLAPPKLGTDGKPIRRSPQEQKNEELFQWNKLAEPLKTPIVGFRNLGNLKFEEVGAVWGLTQPALHNGIAFADLDGDGGLDFIVNNLGNAASIYHNSGNAPRVAVRLKGIAPNTQGIGAKIKLLDGAVPMQSQEVTCGGLYLSGSDPMRVFAAGKSERMSIEVTWRTGKKSVVADVKPNRVYEIDEAASLAKETERVTDDMKPIFKDVSRMISHTHHDELFNDYGRQPLLPYQLSQDGPGVAWVNLSGGKHEELVIGTGRGGESAIYVSDDKGGLILLPTASGHPLLQDLTGIVGGIRGTNQRAMIVGRANYEFLGDLPSASMFSFFPSPQKTDLPVTKASSGPLATADIYGDGTLGLFIGGRVNPGRYPEPADSKIYRNVAGQLQLDAENSRALEKVGLVSGAVWSDLDGDGFPELILACEWGPIRVFKNQRGQLHEITKELGLDRYTGWWRGVTTGDIDGDGRPDIIASNWGLNSEYHASNDQPARLYFGDFAERGNLDIIETVYDPALKAVVPRRMRSTLAVAFPPLVGTFTTHKSYSEATMEQILAILPKPPEQLQATTLASTIFFNRTNRFEARELPYEAQITPAFAVNVGDFDGDGLEDIFLSQNFYAIATGMRLPDDVARQYDAGRGLWLRGTGAGKLESVPGQKSGILIYGEQRGAALGDFDEDGRVDLVVAQNGAETKLYKNVTAKPGLRVRLSGSLGNPDGIGATVRLMFGERFGPAREIHGGSGYWSQDSAIQVMSDTEVPTQIWIRWPGGKTTTSPIPNGAKEITVTLDGHVTMER